MKATVIIPTTGAPEVRDAIDSVLDQTIETQVYLVCDGRENQDKVKRIAENYAGNGFVKVCYLPINVGANGFYGHRVYAAFTHLIDTQYVLYLDQDNTFKPNHVETCINVIEKYGIDWCYSLRSIIDKDSEFVCNDDCESLGKWQTYHGINHVDTNCYCIKTEIAVKLASAWHGGWGQDRVFLHTIAEHFPRFECTRKYTVNYRVNGNPGSVTPEFFKNGNKVMNEKYNGEFPWQKEI
jgi:glycosyltransferase involved in cell wall biosynthesis